MTPRKAFVLAAGLGTRLRPFSLRLPKPAWPFFDLPVAAHALYSLAEAGVREAVVNLHHLPEALRSALEPAAPPGLALRWSPEPDILGTGGALLPWAEFLGDGSFWLVNGDTYRAFGLADMARFHQNRGAAATLGLAPVPPGAAAPIEIDEEGRIVRFLGARPPGIARPGVPCEFTGVHLLEPSILRAAEAADRKAFCINADVHKNLVAGGEPLYGYVSAGVSSDGGVWSDLGTPGNYLALHRELLRLGRVPPHAPGRLFAEDATAPEGGILRAPVFLGEGARVERGAAAGPLAVVGAGAVLVAGADVREAVVWPGTRLSLPLSRAVAAPWGEALKEDGGVGPIG